MPDIAIVTALKEELSAVQSAIAALPEGKRTSVRAVQGGVGLAAAKKAAEALCAERKPSLLCVTGFSGGLQEGLAVGTVVVGDLVGELPPTTASFASHKLSPPLPIKKDLLAKVNAALTTHAIPYKQGPITSSHEPILKPEHKKMLGFTMKALAVDMESGAVSDVARMTGADCLAIRAISDAVGDQLPPEVAQFLDEEGNVKLGQVAKFAMKGPGNIAELMRMKGRADVAGEALRKAWTAILPVLVG